MYSCVMAVVHVLSHCISTYCITASVILRVHHEFMLHQPYRISHVASAILHQPCCISHAASVMQS